MAERDGSANPKAQGQWFDGEGEVFWPNSEPRAWALHWDGVALEQLRAHAAVAAAKSDTTTTRGD